MIRTVASALAAVLALAAGGVSAQQPATEAAAAAFSKAALDFCGPLFEGGATPEKLAATGVAFATEETPAVPALFGEGKTMRGFFALQPTAPDAPYVDGLISGDAGRCAIRLMNAPLAHRALVARLEAKGSGWKRLDSPPGQTESYDLFLRELPGKPYDMLINISHRASGEFGPGGMTAFAQIGRSKKGGK